MTGSTSIPYTLAELIEKAPADKIAIILPEQDIRVTYGALRTQVQAVAEQLAAAGVGRGDRVGIALPNGLPTIVSFLAAVDGRHGGAAESGVQGRRIPLLSRRHRGEGPDPAAGRRRRGATRRRRSRARSSTSTWTPPARSALTGVTAAANRSRRRRSTTSRWCCTRAAAPAGPKRVPLKHANLSISAQNVARSYALTPDDVSLCVMPLFHVHGLVASTLATLATGGTVVVPAKFSPLSFWRVARDHGVTWYSAVPTMHQLLLARAASRRSVAAPGGHREAALHPLVQRVAAAAGDARARGGVRRAGARGLRHDRGRAPDGVEPAAAGRRKPGSVGPRHRRPASASWTRPATTCRTGERGEVVIQGPNVITRLREQPRGQRHVVRRRLVPHRRSGRPRRDGYLTLVGRLKELINRGGEKISPREIDEVLLRTRRSPRRCASACRTARGAKKSQPPSSCATPRARRICSRTAASAWPTTSGQTNPHN